MDNRKNHRQNGGNFMEKFSGHATRFAGSSPAFTIAALVILGWLISGPLFDFSNTWQLVINTCTTIVTFLMVFLIQRTQNKESMVTQLKLNELIASIKGASNRLVDLEDIPESELIVMHELYRHLAEKAEKELDKRVSHSVEEEEDSDNDLDQKKDQS